VLAEDFTGGVRSKRLGIRVCMEYGSHLDLKTFCGLDKDTIVKEIETSMIKKIYKG